MIFQFPSLEALRVVLSSGHVPPAVSLAGAEVAFDAEGRPSIKPHNIPPKAMQNALKRLGIKTGTAHYADARDVATWPEILPITREPGVPEIAATLPVLFELPATQLADVVTEMLRLGNDRQTYRFMSPPNAEDQRVLLKVVGPPYYTLLRAIDHLDANIVAYVERAPRVWIEIGYNHSLASQLRVPEGLILLLRSPNRWDTVDDGPFHDIYSIIDFRLPSAPHHHVEAKLQGKLVVPLRLTAGNAAELPEMWVLRENAFELFDEFVRDADDRLMARLMFAVAPNAENGAIIVLRTRPSKLPPPPIELPAASGYVPFRRLNNLFIPAGSRLQPTLRRDAVRRMLADDPAQIVWLSPLGEGKFAPQTLPDEAFLPLQDWVDYVIDHERDALRSWIEATQFDFESFICKGELAGDIHIPPAAEKKKDRKGSGGPHDAPEESATATTTAKEPKKNQSEAQDNLTAEPASIAPDKLKIQREELEAEFLAIDGPFEAPKRLALWPKLAAINSGLGDLKEASICWLNGMWEQKRLPDEWLWNWLKSEDENAGPQLTKKEINAELAIASPSHSDLRRLAAKLLWACTRQTVPTPVKERLPEIRRYLEEHDESLGVRAVWLVWLHLSKLSGDVLGLARVRDRLVQRLLKSGLKQGLDVNSFIRLAGHKDSDRIRKIQDSLTYIHRQTHIWLDSQEERQKPSPFLSSSSLTKDDQLKAMTYDSLKSTGLYIDLIFSFGYARIGDVSRCKEQLTSCVTALRRTNKKNEHQRAVRNFLADAFEYRIVRALNGQPSLEEPLPSQVIDQIKALDNTQTIVVDRIRKHLRILEPYEKTDPYLAFKTSAGEKIGDKLAAIRLISEPKRLETEIRKVVRGEGSTISEIDMLSALKEMLPISMRVGEPLTKELLRKTLSVLTPPIGMSKGKKDEKVQLETVRLHAKLADAAIWTAASCGWANEVEILLKRFVDNLRVLDEESICLSIGQGLSQWVRILRKIGLRDRIEPLLTQLTELVMKGRSLESLRADHRKSTSVQWTDVLRSLLLLAEYWIYFGLVSKASPILAEVRGAIVAAPREPRQILVVPRYVQLVSGYIRCISQMNDIDAVIEQILAVFRDMESIPNTSTAKQYCSPFHLDIVENIVLSLVSEDFILGETARRWLDDDEYLIRRRIHSDMEKDLKHSGL